MKTNGMATRFRMMVLAAIMATMFMAAVESTVVATAMPTIVAKLGGFDLFSWVFASYLLTQAITTPIYGALADMYGRKPLLLAAIALFVLGSVLCGLAWNMVSLIVFRAVQGIGAGALLPLGLTVVGDLYGPQERPRVQGYLSSIWAMAAILGPALGAYLVTHLSWPMVFWINLPLAAVTVIILALGFKERVQPRAHKLDLLGTFLMALSTAVLVGGLVQTAHLNALTLTALLLLAGLLFAALLGHERRIPEPLLPLDLWSNRIFVAGNLANGAFGGIIMAISAFLPTYVQGVLGGSAMNSGMVLGIMSLSWPLGTILAGRTMLRYSYRAAALTGGLLLAAGALLLATLETSQGLAWACGGATLTGLGLGFGNNTFVVVVQGNVNWGQRAAATSSMLFTRMICQSVATAVFGGILNVALLAKAGADHSLMDRLMETAQRQTLPTAQRDALLQAIISAMHKIYAINGLLAVLVVIAALWLPKGLSPSRPDCGPRRA